MPIAERTDVGEYVYHVLKGNPYGDNRWVGGVIKKFGLEQTLRKVGRPKANNGG